MKKFVGAAIVAAQLLSAPAMAASLAPVETLGNRTGAFAGARLRIGIGGHDAGQLRAGIGIAPLRSAQALDGRLRISLGEGVEFGIRGKSAPRLSFAGRSIDEIRLQADGKGGVPTWALVAGGVVLAVGIAAAVFIDKLEDSSE